MQEPIGQEAQPAADWFGQVVLTINEIRILPSR